MSLEKMGRGEMGRDIQLKNLHRMNLPSAARGLPIAGNNPDVLNRAALFRVPDTSCLWGKNHNSKRGKKQRPLLFEKLILSFFSGGERIPF
jgi:hypothetical protein